jgi:hypothetical protein
MLVSGNLAHPFPVDQQTNKKLATEIRGALNNQSRSFAARRWSGRRPRFRA